MTATPSSDTLRATGLLDVLIRAGLIAVLAIISYRIFRPFLDLMLWSVILAITFYPLQRRLRGRLGNKEGLTATLMVLVAIGLLVVPIYLLGAVIGSSARDMIGMARSGTFVVPPPSDAVAGWPLVVPKLHAFWQEAATNLTAFTQHYAPQIKAMVVGLLGKLANFGLSLVVFIIALIVAGIVMAYGENGHRSAVRAISRVVGSARGPAVTVLCTATIRAVAQGVIGIAFIQMFLIGIALVLMGVPGAGLLAIAVLFLGIVQAPATLITVPVIAYVLTTQGVTPGTIVFSVYLFIAGLVDNVLKPLLLGRGVDVPMPVVLIGALGGMVSGGVIGLFIGPVILAVAYQLFWQWVDNQPASDASLRAFSAPAESLGISLALGL